MIALGIDVGSSNTKAALVRIEPGCPNGVIEIALRSAPTPVEAGSLVRVVFALVADLLVGNEAPQAVGIASMAETGVPLASGGRPLLPFQRWDSASGQADLDTLLDVLDPDHLFAATGVPALPKAPLVTWHRLRREQPDVWDAMAHWAGAADVVARALTGRLATDHTLAARTMAFRSSQPEPPGGGWIPEALAAAGLTADRLPPVLDPGQAVGLVTRAAAARGGDLPAGIPVHIAGHDHVVAAWGAGMRQPGDRADSLGTAEAVLRVLERPADPGEVARAGMSLTRTVDGRPLLLAGTAAGAVLRAYPSGPAADGLSTTVLLPYPAGRQSPLPDPSATAILIDEAGHETDAGVLSDAELRHAAVAGLAHQARWMLDEQTRIAGPVETPIHLIPGRALSDRDWMYAKSALAPSPLLMTTAREPVAASAALLAAVRSGLVGEEAPVLPSAPAPAALHDHTESHRRFVDAATRPRGDR